MFSPFSISVKMEVNLLRSRTASGDHINLARWVIKNRVPAIVVDPLYVEASLVERMKHRGQYKIICSVDFESGKHYGLEKMRPLPKSIMTADGFDILLTSNRTDKEYLNELRILSEFIHENIHKSKEIRWTLGLRTREQATIALALPHIKKWPATFIRTDHNVLPAKQENEYERHIRDVKFIREYTGLPIKISGNIDYETYLKLKGDVKRFDVTLDQAKSIIKTAQSVSGASEQIQEDLEAVKADMVVDNPENEE